MHLQLGVFFQPVLRLQNEPPPPPRPTISVSPAPAVNDVATTKAAQDSEDDVSQQNELNDVESSAPDADVGDASSTVISNKKPTLQYDYKEGKSRHRLRVSSTSRHDHRKIYA